MVTSFKSTASLILGHGPDNLQLSEDNGAVLVSRYNVPGMTESASTVTTATALLRELRALFPKGYAE